MYDVIAAIAPRAFFMHNGEKDASYPAEGFKETYRRAGAAWEIYGVPEGIGMYLSPGGHGMPPESRRRAYEFLDRVLKVDR